MLHIDMIQKRFNIRKFTNDKIYLKKYIYNEEERITISSRKIYKIFINFLVSLFYYFY